MLLVKPLKNRVSRSGVIDFRIPCNLTTLQKNNFVTLDALDVFLQGMKWPIFNNLSTIINTKSIPHWTIVNPTWNLWISSPKYAHALVKVYESEGYGIGPLTFNTHSTISQVSHILLELRPIVFIWQCCNGLSSTQIFN